MNSEELFYDEDDYDTSKEFHRERQPGPIWGTGYHSIKLEFYIENGQIKIWNLDSDKLDPALKPLISFFVDSYKNFPFDANWPPKSDDAFGCELLIEYTVDSDPDVRVDPRYPEDRVSPTLGYSDALLRAYCVKAANGHYVAVSPYDTNLTTVISVDVPRAVGREIFLAKYDKILEESNWSSHFIDDVYGDDDDLREGYIDELDLVCEGINDELSYGEDDGSEEEFGYDRKVVAAFDLPEGNLELSYRIGSNLSDDKLPLFRLDGRYINDDLGFNILWDNRDSFQYIDRRDRRRSISLKDLVLDMIEKRMETDPVHYDMWSERYRSIEKNLIPYPWEVSLIPLEDFDDLYKG